MLIKNLGSANFFYNGQDSNCFQKLGYMQSPSQLFSFAIGAQKPAIGNTWENEHISVPIKLYLQIQAGDQIWHLGIIIYDSILTLYPVWVGDVPWTLKRMIVYI